MSLGLSPSIHLFKYLTVRRVADFYFIRNDEFSYINSTVFICLKYLYFRKNDEPSVLMLFHLFWNRTIWSTKNDWKINSLLSYVIRVVTEIECYPGWKVITNRMFSFQVLVGKQINMWQEYTNAITRRSKVKLFNSSSPNFYSRQLLFRNKVPIKENKYMDKYYYILALFTAARDILPKQWPKTNFILFTGARKFIHFHFAFQNCCKDKLKNCMIWMKKVMEKTILKTGICSYLFLRICLQHFRIQIRFLFIRMDL